MSVQVEKETPKDDKAEEKPDEDTEMTSSHPKKADEMDIDENKEEEKELKPASPIIQEKAELIIAEVKSAGNITDGIERLLLLEKKQRQSEDEANTIYLAHCILQLCHERGDWKLLIEQISVLTRRRSQFRRCVMRIVQKAMGWIDSAPDKELQLQLIDTLISVTEGKIFVEVERARLTRKLAEIKESEGNIAEAADILQELQIETFGAMEKREKCDFLLEQVRLLLSKRDFIRAGIIRNKITRKIIADLSDLEIKYWNLSLIYFYHRDQQWLELAKSYQRLKDLLIKPDEQVQALSNAVFALVLAPHGNEQFDLLHRIVETEKKLLEQLPLFRELLKLLTTWELISWPLPTELSKKLNSFSFVGVHDANQTFESLLHDRIVQHNIRVVAKYYNRISTQRLSQFLGVDINDTEKYVSEMVTDATVFARMDRIAGIIRFRKKETPNSILNDWRSNIDQLLELVDQTCHQIHKEVVVHGSKKKAAKGGAKKKAKKSKKNKA